MRRPIETRVVILIGRSLRVQVDRFELRICGASGARPGAHQPLAPPESLQGPRGRERQRRTTVGFSEINHHRDAAVLPSSLTRTLRVRNDLPFRCLSVAHHPHSIGRHTLPFEVLRNCFGALLTKPEVVRLAARGIGETLDGDDRLLVIPADHLSKAIQNGFILRSDGSVIEGKVDGGAEANRGLQALDSDFKVAAKLAQFRLQGCKSSDFTDEGDPSLLLTEVNNELVDREAPEIQSAESDVRKGERLQRARMGDRLNEVTRDRHWQEHKC